MGVGLFAVSKEQTLDKRTVLEFELSTHFFHVNHRFMFVQLVVDGEVLQVL